MKRFTERKRIFAIPMFLVAFAVISFITMLLWNVLLPEIFHLPQISFWQALGLHTLLRMFFGFNALLGGHHDHRRDFRNKWEHMNPEKRDEFKNHWYQRRSAWGKPKDNPVNQVNSEK